ncbi:hypothetical protein [Xanthomonas citri]|uniref:hypothetical protein n=1 Tax=Xanthomonas citri TaxID=346 RepID=UPI00138F2744|nr:hypothetical protein [Xanthomonas citri]
MKEPIERHRAIVNDYIQLTEPERRETLIVAGTNEARREINRMVRESLDLTGKGAGVRHADPRGHDAGTAPLCAELSAGHGDPAREGRPESRPDAEARPTASRTHCPAMHWSCSGRTAPPPRSTRARRRSSASTALSAPSCRVGDTVRINRNDPGRDLTNGDRMRVAGVIGGVVKLESVEQRDGRPARALRAARRIDRSTLSTPMRPPSTARRA